MLAWGRPGCHRTRPGDSRQPAGRGKAAAALAWRPGCQGVINGAGEEKANKGVPNLDAASFFFFSGRPLYENLSLGPFS